MPTLSEMKTDLFGIGHVLNSNLLRVPRYQRSYSWLEKNVGDLFTDLNDAMREDEEEYFLGSVVAVHTDSSRVEVVDGQQRLATTSILLAAIRDYFYVTGNEDRAADVERDYLMKRERRSQDTIPNIELNEADHDYFYKRILLRPDAPERQIVPTKESHERLHKAAIVAEDFISRVTSDTTEPIDRLLDWMDYLDKNAKIIWVRVRDDANAFTIFETLNDRGLALAIADLLKNFLFSRARDRLDEVQQRWLGMVGVLEPLDGEDVVIDFIRHYWLSKYGVKRKNELYSDIKARTTSRQRVIDLATELNNGSTLYEGIINPDAAIWGRYAPAAIEHMSTLNLLGMVQIRPLLLAVLGEFGVDDVNTTMRLAVSWAVRFLAVGNLGGGVLEGQYAKHAIQVRHKEITTAAQLAEAMRRIVPSDVQFRDSFETMSVPKFNRARFYLRILDMVAQGDTNPVLVASGNPQAVNLEHILPQNPSPEWRVDRETAKTYHNRLGNLALLETKINRQLANRLFSEKSRDYRDSVFWLTREVANQTEWSVKQIQERQQRLARLAVAAWPV